MSTRIVFLAVAVPALLLCLSGSAGAQAELGGSPGWANPDTPLPCERLGEPVSGALVPGEELRFTYELESGSYSFIAWASLDLVSLEMTVRSAVGTVLAEDEGLDNMPLCCVAIESSETVEVFLRAGEGRVENPQAVYAFASARGDACFERPAFPAKAILDEWTGIVTEEDALVTSWNVSELEGEDSLIYEYRLEPGSYTAVAETTSPGDDIDMYVRVDPETVISRDELPHNFAICYFVLDNPADVTIEIDPWEYAQGDRTTIVVLLARDSEGEP